MNNLQKQTIKLVKANTDYYNLNYCLALKYDKPSQAKAIQIIETTKDGRV